MHACTVTESAHSFVFFFLFRDSCFFKLVVRFFVKFVYFFVLLTQEGGLSGFPNQLEIFRK